MIVVLRAGHRINRDKRITTHVALVARAFSADKMVVTTKDTTLEKTIRSVCQRFGGSFELETGVDQRKFIRQWNGTVVHLTMYGADLETSLSQIDTTKDVLVLVGAEKVPAFFYEVADYNISVGNQPHSEVAALALFLDRFTHSSWMKHSFDGDLQIIPSNRGKRVVSKQPGGKP